MAIKKEFMRWVYDDETTLPKEEQRRRLYISDIADKFDDTYEALYNNSNLEDMLENYGFSNKMIDKTEEFFKTEEGKKFIKDWNELVGEPITSDREYIALAIALYL
jgi:hypothetical protein